MRTTLLPSCLLLIAANTICAESFTISTDRQAYLLGEPVYLCIRGRSDRPVALEYGEYKLVIAPEREAPFVYRPPLHLDAFETTDKPVEQVDYSTLVVKRGGLLFAEPGMYSLALYKSPKGGIPESNTLIIEFAEPWRPSDMQALRAIEARPYEYALVVYLRGGEHISSGYEIIKAIAGGTSAYAGHAKFVLSCSYSYGWHDFVTGESRPSMPEKALMYSRCMEEGEDEFVRLRNARALQTLIDGAEHLGVIISQAMADSVREHVNTALNECPHPDSELYRSVRARHIQER